MVVVVPGDLRCRASLSFVLISMLSEFAAWRGEARTLASPGACWPWRRSTRVARGRRGGTHRRRHPADRPGLGHAVQRRWAGRAAWPQGTRPDDTAAGGPTRTAGRLALQINFGPIPAVHHGVVRWRGCAISANGCGRRSVSRFRPRR